jgi:hypothetical protein
MTILGVRLTHTDWIVLSHMGMYGYTIVRDYYRYKREQRVAPVASKGVKQ